MTATRLFSTRQLALLASTAVGLCLQSLPAAAACTFVPTAGDDIYVCDSGTSAGFTDLGGNNTLTLPAGGTGTITSAITFGAGVDTVEIHSGAISANLQQGDGRDSFTMTGGTLQSLNQGTGLDTFFMSGGHIVGFFDDGDSAVMTGGRIGRVNMLLDDNLFAMSGGTIDNNLVTGFGNDTIILSGGSIGGNISVSGGTDSVTVTGGAVGGNVLMSFGTDTFTWDGGGTIEGSIDLGADTDIATLRNLTSANLAGTDALTGGLGVDGLTLEDVQTGGVARFQSWENIDARAGSVLTFDGNLTLGDSGTGTGTLNVDAASTLRGGGTNAAISAATIGQLVTVNNSGTIDLSDVGASTSDRFTVNGNYSGNSGLLVLDTVLGDDSSASDRLVVSGGTATGTTAISVVNAGGAGADTLANGIMVVELANGATSAASAFALNGRVAAGAHEYLLYRGGVTAGSEQNFYLRSTLVVVPTPITPPPEIVPPIIVVPPQVPPTVPPVVEPEIVIVPPGPGVAPPSDGATPVEPETVIVDIGGIPTAVEIVPLYRVEVATYSAVPPIAEYLALSSLGTFHERRGEQSLLDGAGALTASWGRVFGQKAELQWKGSVDPGFDGNLLGFQIGQDLFGWETEGGHHDRVGVFFSHARADGDITGQAVGWNNLHVGEIDVRANSLGGYWTHIGPGGWYLDAVLMGTWFDGDARSIGGSGVEVDGTGVTASLEAGYPIALGENWTLEPQAQIIWQHLSLDDQRDAFSTVKFDGDNAVTGRLGFRLQGEVIAETTTFQPYLKANLWHNFDADQRVTFGTDPIVTETGGTALELGGGLVAKLSETASLYVTADYTTNLGGEKIDVLEGNIGLRVKW
ncbi:autotransporter outer membrane beta-barrel domain-containing protein [Ensifer sp. LC13]|nr:autotransporter outer membrane beta-barrel domain-containing protein [Ensifer sp. LC11]OCP00384.1 autotransporter outer membrane beta-barrel domain-containing protein [Ensifer sp. LC13]OCP04152.1 autotransporter outer membrane beta-barrel domain-containing protein [Ensifer sp. LC14]OCP31426.1 autotransporter outer membrane beta-barrel domain-containing protein [Ensifer sp. LC499]